MFVRGIRAENLAAAPTAPVLCDIQCVITMRFERTVVLRLRLTEHTLPRRLQVSCVGTFLYILISDPYSNAYSDTFVKSLCGIPFRTLFCG